MKIKFSNVKSFYHKACRFGLFIPLSNVILLYGAKWLPDSFLHKMNKRRNELIEKGIREIVGDIRVDEAQLNPTESPKIWMVWFSGEENLPPLQKMCVESVKRNANGHEVVVISLQNYKKYIEIPEKILELYHAGILNPANLADVIRIRLLSKHGGFWIDSTVYVTEPISEEIYSYNVYAMKQKPRGFFVSECRWSLFCFYMDRKSLLPHLVDAMLMKYWEKETYIIDYFLKDYLIDIAVRDYPSVKEDIDRIPFNSPDAHTLSKMLCDEFDAKEFERLTSKTSMFKLSWKVFTPEQLAANPNNYYHHLLKGI